MEHGLQRLNAEQRTRIWMERIAECRSSGKSVRTWCEEHEISEKTYYYWQRKLYQQMVLAGEAVSFEEISIREETCQSSTASAKIMLSGASVEVYPGADTETIHAIIQALREC